MSHYAGLDVSLEETAICVVDAMGRIVKEMRVPSEPECVGHSLEGARPSLRADRPGGVLADSLASRRG